MGQANTTQGNNETIDISIPNRFNDPNILCIRLGRKAKEPAEKKVTYHSCSSSVITDWIAQGYNVGATSLTGFCVFVDGDTKEIQDALERRFSKIFKWNTGKPGHCQYAFFLADEPLEKSIPLKDGAYVKTKKGYVVIPPSIHPNGRQYGETVIGDSIPVVKKADLLEVLTPFILREEKKQTNDGQEYERPNIDSLQIADIVDTSRLTRRGMKHQGPHPIHGSEGGQNFIIDTSANTWYCFRHATGGGPLQWIAVAEGIISCQDAKPGAIRGMTFWQVIAAAHNRYGLEYDRAAEMLRMEK